MVKIKQIFHKENLDKGVDKQPHICYNKDKKRERKGNQNEHYFNHNPHNYSLAVNLYNSIECNRWR